LSLDTLALSSRVPKLGSVLHLDPVGKTSTDSPLRPLFPEALAAADLLPACVGWTEYGSVLCP
jgi:hypothetical protein